MAEINRAEELTPEEENSVSGEKGLELDENLGQQGEKEGFNYEQRKEEIENRYQERHRRHEDLIKEIFGREDIKGSHTDVYLETLLKARRKAQEQQGNPEDKRRFSMEEELALALDKKREEIEGEQSEAIKKLNQKRQEDREKRIGEI